MSIALNRFDDLEDTDLLACTDTDGITYKVTGAQFKALFEEEVEETEPLTLVEDPTIIVNNTTFTVGTDSVVTGGKPSYTYKNEWLGAKLVESSNQYKSYTVGINNKGQAVLPTSTIATTPKPVSKHYYTVNSGVTWNQVPSDFGAKGEVAWNEEEQCFVCGYLGEGYDTSKEGPRLVYPRSPEKNKYLHLETPRDLGDGGLERFYGVRAHPTLPNTYTVATSSPDAVNSATIVMFEIDFEAGTATYIQALGPTRINTSYGRGHGEYNGIGYFVQAENFFANTGKVYLNEEGLFSTDQRKWIRHSFTYHDWAEVCFIQDTIYVSKVSGVNSIVYEFDGSSFAKIVEGEFWRQIGDYVYKASKTSVFRSSSIDGSNELLATFDQASSNPTFIDFAGGDLAVVFNDGSVKFSDNGTVLQEGDSITSTEAVTLKQKVTDQKGEFVVGSATAEPAFDETPFTVSNPHQWVSSVNAGVEQNVEVSFYPVVFEGGHPISSYNRYQITAVTDEGTTLYNISYDNTRTRRAFQIKGNPGETFTITYTATSNDNSLEVVTDPVEILAARPWKNFDGGVFHIRGVSDTNETINLGDTSLTVYVIENDQVTKQPTGTNLVRVSKTREAVVCARNGTSSVFANNFKEFVFAEYTDISRTNTLNRLCFNCTNFNDPSIGDWDVGHITNMNQTFSGCYAFNQDLRRWNVQNVTNMGYMFQDAFEYNQDLSDWCVYRFLEEPDGFSVGAINWDLPKPPWGVSC